MIRALLSWLTGGGISAIGAQINRAYEAKLNAANDSERMAADITLRQLQARQAVLIAEQSDGLTRWVRPAFAYPAALYHGKIYVWDKVLGWGVTDPLDERMWWVSVTIIGAYFLTRPFEKVLRK